MKLARFSEKDRRVRAGPAIDGVVAAPPVQRVVGAGTRQCLRGRATDDEGVAGRLDRDRDIRELDVFDVGQENVIECVDTDTRCIGVLDPDHAAEIADREIGAVLEKYRRVRAGPAIDGVVAAPPVQRVVGAGTQQCLRGRATDDEGVAGRLDRDRGIRELDVFDVGQENVIECVDT